MLKKLNFKRENCSLHVDVGIKWNLINRIRMWTYLAGTTHKEMCPIAQTILRTLQIGNITHNTPCNTLNNITHYRKTPSHCPPPQNPSHYPPPQNPSYMYRTMPPVYYLPQPPPYCLIKSFSPRLEKEDNE